jgi:hypothetical protein
MQLIVSRKLSLKYKYTHNRLSISVFGTIKMCLIEKYKQRKLLCFIYFSKSRLPLCSLLFFVWGPAGLLPGGVVSLGNVARSAH